MAAKRTHTHTHTTILHTPTSKYLQFKFNVTTALIGDVILLFDA